MASRNRSFYPDGRPRSRAWVRSFVILALSSGAVQYIGEASGLAILALVIPALAVASFFGSALAFVCSPRWWAQRMGEADQMRAAGSLALLALATIVGAVLGAGLAWLWSGQ